MHVLPSGVGRTVTVTNSSVSVSGLIVCFETGTVKDEVGNVDGPISCVCISLNMIYEHHHFSGQEYELPTFLEQRSTLSRLLPLALR